MLAHPKLKGWFKCRACGFCRKEGKKMIKFIKTPDEDNVHDLATIEVELPNHLTTDQMLEYFRDFMLACGYSVKEITEVSE